MLRMIIVGLALVVVIPSVGNGQWGAAAVAVVVAVLLLMMGSEERKDTKAWLNCRDYWANGGPAQYRDGHSVQKLFATQRQPEVQHVPYRCARCGGHVHEVCRTVYNGGATFVTYGCPGCGEQKMVKLQ